MFRQGDRVKYMNHVGIVVARLGGCCHCNNYRIRIDLKDQSLVVTASEDELDFAQEDKYGENASKV